MARLIWTEPALKDVKEITAFIAKDSPMYARRFGHQLRQAPKRLKRFPLIGWVVPEFERDSLREILVGNYRSFMKFEGPIVWWLLLFMGVVTSHGSTSRRRRKKRTIKVVS